MIPPQHESAPWSYWTALGTKAILVTMAALPWLAPKLSPPVAAVMLVGALGATWGVHWFEYRMDQRAQKVATLCNFLELWLRDPDNGFDPSGQLGGRMNVMTVRYWTRGRPGLFSIRWPKVHPKGVATILACTQRLRRAPDEQIELSYDKGVVGKLWASGHGYAYAPVDSQKAVTEYELEPEQAEMTKDLTCIVSCAILDSGIAHGKRLLGFLNLDATTRRAYCEWWDVRTNEPRQEVRERLLIVAEEIFERGYLPL